MKKIFILSFASLLFTACAHHPDVRPGVDGINVVTVVNEDKEGGSRDALSQANSFCKESKRYAAIVSEEQKYTGSMDEADYQKGKTISKVAQGVGGAAFVFGGKKESTAGGIVGLGGSVANSVYGKGYTVTIKFKCM